MPPYTPDRVVRSLTAVVSVAYFVAWIGAAVVLTAAPAVKAFGGAGAEWVWGLHVPATTLDSATTVLTNWGSAQLVIEDVRGALKIPLAMLPWWLVAVLWTHAAVVAALLLMALHQLRSIFRRVRDGIPFDQENASRMRRLGLLLLALALFNGIAELATALAISDRLVSDDVTVSVAFRVDPMAVFLALVLVTLAEIFRRGAELEHEQSLVI